MSDHGVDAAQRLDPAAVKAAGIRCVLRYLAPLPNPKVITIDEAHAHIAAGVDLVLVWEFTANRALSPQFGGPDGAEAKRQADLLGYPAGSAIYWAVDFPAQQAQMAAIAGYGRAFAGACGRPARPYGSDTLLDAMVAAGVCDAGWQTIAWSQGRTSPHAAIYQHAAGPTIAGVPTDLNDLLAPYGGWLTPLRPNSPTPPPSGAPDPMLVKITKSGQGYWLVTQNDGGVDCYGDATFHGSVPGLTPVPTLDGPITGFDVMPGEDGYILTTRSGLYAFGTAEYRGKP